MTKKTILLILFFTGIKISFVFSQTAKQQDEKAMQLMDKALGNLWETNNIGIWFDGIAYSVQKPIDIFTLPVYQIVRGGFLFADNEKFEIQLGNMKSLCDGKLLVVVDENSKTMYIDSARKQDEQFGKEAVPEIEKILNDTFGEGIITYEGTEFVNKKRCHKIKAGFTNEEKTHVYYWIEEKTGQLYLMAEWQNNAYDVYWFKSIGKAPKNHVYSIYLPEKTLETLYGYTVIDNRYFDVQLNQKED